MKTRRVKKLGNGCEERRQLQDCLQVTSPLILQFSSISQVANCAAKNFLLFDGFEGKKKASRIITSFVGRERIKQITLSFDSSKARLS